MSIGFWQIMIIAIIVVLLFGRGKISELMGDVAKGIKSFKAGMAEEEQPDQQQSKTIEHNEAATVEPSEKKQNVS